MTKHWYVVHAYSGFEKNVARSLGERIELSNLQEHFGKVLVPTEEVVEMRAGQKRRSERKFFPGYVLVEMDLNDDTWHLVKNTPKVSTFLGSKGMPIPISNTEAAKISEQVLQGIQKPRPSVEFEIGEVIKVIDGPFASFDGMIEQIDEDKARLRVAVSIFGRSTPVDLDYSQVHKV